MTSSAPSLEAESTDRLQTPDMLQLHAQVRSCTSAQSNALPPHECVYVSHTDAAWGTTGEFTLVQLAQECQSPCSSPHGRQVPAVTAQEEPCLNAADREAEDEAEHDSDAPADDSPRAPECPAGEQVCLAALLITFTI